MHGLGVSAFLLGKWIKMKIKIISDGLAENTKVINVETGKLIEDIATAEWSCKVKELATAKLTFINVAIEAVGEVENG